MKKITTIGTGYTGLVTSEEISRLVHQVTCIDINKDIIKKLNIGEIPIYEPKLKSLLKTPIVLDTKNILNIHNLHSLGSKFDNLY